MQAEQYHQLIDQLQKIICDTLSTLDAFEKSQMDNKLHAEYEQLHAILKKATEDQRHYQHALLKHTREA